MDREHVVASTSTIQFMADSKEAVAKPVFQPTCRHGLSSNCSCHSIINPSKEALHDLYEFIGFSNHTFHGSSVSDEKKFFELESIVKSRSGRNPAELPSERPAFQWLPKIKAVLNTEKGRALNNLLIIF